MERHGDGNGAAGNGDGGPGRRRGPLSGIEAVAFDVRRGPAQTDERLLALVEMHIQAEAADLEGYRELASSPDPVVRELMGVLVEDEERHHALLKRLAIRLSDDLNCERSPDALPPERSPLDADGRRALAKVREFVRHEHTGAQRLHALAAEARDLQRPSLPCCWKPWSSTARSTRRCSGTSSGGSSVPGELVPKRKAVLHVQEGAGAPRRFTSGGGGAPPTPHTWRVAPTSLSGPYTRWTRPRWRRGTGPGRETRHGSTSCLSRDPV